MYGFELKSILLDKDQIISIYKILKYQALPYFCLRLFLGPTVTNTSFNLPNTLNNRMMNIQGRGQYSFW